MKLTAKHVLTILFSAGIVFTCHEMIRPTVALAQGSLCECTEDDDGDGYCNSMGYQYCGLTGCDETNCGGPWCTADCFSFID